MNANRPILIALHKTQFKVDQRPEHKSSFIEPDRKESAE